METSSKHIRCEICRKKLGLMSHRCKCEKIFCISHLHVESHNCSYLHKEDHREILKKSMEIGPLSDKMQERI